MSIISSLKISNISSHLETRKLLKGFTQIPDNPLSDMQKKMYMKMLQPKQIYLKSTEMQKKCLIYKKSKQ